MLKSFTTLVAKVLQGIVSVCLAINDAGIQETGGMTRLHSPYLVQDDTASHPGLNCIPKMIIQYLYKASVVGNTTETSKSENNKNILYERVQNVVVTKF